MPPSVIESGSVSEEVLWLGRAFDHGGNGHTKVKSRGLPLGEEAWGNALWLVSGQGKFSLSPFRILYMTEMKSEMGPNLWSERACYLLTLLKPLPKFLLLFFIKLRDHVTKLLNTTSTRLITVF